MVGFVKDTCMQIQWSRVWDKGLVKIAILVDCNPYNSNVMAERNKKNISKIY